jgi:TetR/AcrR family transcriptional regulator
MPTTKRTPRRAAPDDRRRDPERTRERILQAAVDEFGARGFTGARVSRIASAAEVNSQLISYHFDGKAGLYRAVVERWRGVTEAIPQPGRGIAEIAGAFVRINNENRNFARLLAWEALGDSPESGEDSQETERSAFFGHIANDFRRRQEAGELPADVDPAHLLLALVAIASAPVALPQLARRIVGEDPDSSAFQEAYAQQVERIVGHLAR